MYPAGAKRLNLSMLGSVYDHEAPVSSLGLQDRIENLLARRGETGSPSSDQLNEVYTDGCAAILALETERLRVKRRMTAAALDAGQDPDSAREAAELALRGDQIVVELARLKQLVRELRVAIDFAQDSLLDEAPRRRFRRG